MPDALRPAIENLLMAGRSDARRQVVQMLYLIDQNPDADIHRIQRTINEELKDAALCDFAWSLFCGVREKRPALDELIRQTASNWRLERMTTTDRNVLRLGLYEMQHFGTPAPVVLNESIEIAREFGTENSAGFVNGVLDKLMPKTDTPETHDDIEETESDVASEANSENH